MHRGGSSRAAKVNMEDFCSLLYENPENSRGSWRECVYARV